MRNNFLETDTCPFDQEFVCLCTKKFVRTVYQEILVFYYFKNSIKRYPQNGENAYLVMKDPSFQGPKAGPGPQPIRAHFICMTPLHGVGKNQPKNSGLPPLTKSLIRPCRPPTSFPCHVAHCNPSRDQSVRLSNSCEDFSESTTSIHKSTFSFAATFQVCEGK